jgi:hypothetical protein
MRGSDLHPLGYLKTLDDIANENGLLNTQPLANGIPHNEAIDGIRLFNMDEYG